VYPGSPNPYIPWQGNPLGMILGPLALLAILRGKRKAGKVDQILVVLVVPRDTYGYTYRVSSSVKNRNVMFFCSTSTESENLRAQSVHHDIAEGRYQYYGTRAFTGCTP
jgi:hypothetical protein